MLTSVAGGDFERWAQPQMMRFGLGMAAMLVVAMIPIWFWRNVAALAYGISILLLVLVEFFGVVGMGAQRWIDIGPLRLQPSELTKITSVMLLAAYYDWLDIKKVSRPLWVLIPVLLILLPAGLTLIQPDLGTAILIILGGGIVMFAAGVSWWYFGAVAAAGVGLVVAVFASRGTPWQLLRDYQYRRIDTFMDPSVDPLGAGYHITQSKIALGSGGLSGKGFMQGTQSRLNFLPEKHTDFIFTTLAEEFGFIGSMSLLALYALIIVFGLMAAVQNRDRFSALLIIGIIGS
jgi:rod shape determining protein RodA